MGTGDEQRWEIQDDFTPVAVCPLMEIMGLTCETFLEFTALRDPRHWTFAVPARKEISLCVPGAPAPSKAQAFASIPAVQGLDASLSARGELSLCSCWSTPLTSRCL